MSVEAPQQLQLSQKEQRALNKEFTELSRKYSKLIREQEAPDATTTHWATDEASGRQQVDAHLQQSAVETRHYHDGNLFDVAEPSVYVASTHLNSLVGSLAGRGIDILEAGHLYQIEDAEVPNKMNVLVVSVKELIDRIKQASFSGANEEEQKAIALGAVQAVIEYIDQEMRQLNETSLRIAMAESQLNTQAAVDPKIVHKIKTLLLEGDGITELAQLAQEELKIDIRTVPAPERKSQQIEKRDILRRLKTIAQQTGLLFDHDKELNLLESATVDSQLEGSPANRILDTARRIQADTTFHSFLTRLQG